MMDNSSYHDNQTLTIHNRGNLIANEFYQIHTPFLITYVFCSGTDSEDYINYVILSEQDRNIKRETYSSHDEVFRLHPPHYHDFFEIMIVLEGSITQRIENQDYRYDAGSCSLITRSLCHFETFNSTAKILFIGLSVDLICDFFDRARHSLLSEEKEIYNSELYKFIMEDIKNPGQKAYLDFIPTLRNTRSQKGLHYWGEEIINALMMPHFGSSLMARGALCSIISYLASPENYYCTLTSLDHSSDFLIFSRVEHILQEKNGRVSRSELSRLLNYSGDYINRIVNKYTGMCLSEYGMSFCLNEAAIRLRTTTDSISAIAEDLGFSNRSYFYKIFQNQFGMTPKEYRNKEDL